MTDNEIIRDFEFCINTRGSNCTGCSFELEGAGCCTKLLNKVLSLLREQQSEIKRLNSLCTSKDVIINSQETEIKRLKEYPKCAYEFDGEVIDYCLKSPCSNFKAENEIKSEVIKDFAERLRQRFLALDYKPKTKRKTIEIEVVKDTVEWVLKSVTIDIINEELEKIRGAL